MKMENELKELKSMLRSLVVSSPTEVDLRTLLRDYRNMMGEPIPITKFGYRDGLTFIKERCNDCFVIRDPGCNPVLTLIVPDSVKHIDNFVQRQKSSSTTRFKGKRRSVPETAFKAYDLVVKTFKPKQNNVNIKTDYTKVEENQQIVHEEPSNKCIDTDHNEVTSNPVRGSRTDDSEKTNGVCSSNALQNFMKKRMPMFTSSQYLDSDLCLDKDSSKGDTDSGRQTSSSNSSSKRAQLEELKMEIREVVGEVPEGVWCMELMKLYREKYGRELNFSRFGYTSVASLAYAVEGLRHLAAEHSGDVLLQAGAGAGGGGVRAPRAAPAAPARPLRTGDPDDALPGIDFDEDVFPRDCMHQMQSIPAQPLDELAAGAMLEVVLGEVYSPTHFWMLRLGPDHYSAMEALMDEMNTYYRGEGRERVLAGGALRVGHYCACCYCGDWHRAIIVKILDSDTVKVRHIDYATVETVSARALKPLLLRWATLPAQAVRARLAGARPPAAGRRWPWAASSHFLHLIRERQLVAYVVAKDAQEGILEVLLIDTSTQEDVCISTEMCRSGHADPRPDSALGVSARYDCRSPRDDMRSLLGTLGGLRQERAASDVSASASDLVGRGPCLLEPWDGDASDVTAATASSASTATHQRLRLAAIRASILSRPLDDSDAESDASLPDSVNRLSPAERASDGPTVQRNEPGLDGSESVLSAIQERLQLLNKLKRTISPDIDQNLRQTSDGPQDSSRTNTPSTASPATVRKGNSGGGRDLGSSDGNESMCSAIEARVRKIHELRLKQQAGAGPVDESPGVITIPDRSHIGQARLLDKDKGKSKTRDINQNYDSTLTGSDSSDVSVASSAVEVRFKKQREMARQGGVLSGGARDADAASESDNASVILRRLALTDKLRQKQL